MAFTGFEGKSTSHFYDKHQEANVIDYIQNELPIFFGVKSQKKAAGLAKGRHPNSFKKDSELYHYLKVSNEKKTRVYKGHRFWEVIEEECVAKKPPMEAQKKEKEMKEKKIREMEDSLEQLAYIAPGSHDRRHSTTLSQQPSKLKNKAYVNLNADVKNKNLVNYGMGFILMNYADEIVYLNRKNELRCKPMNMIRPSDRTRFKIVDIQNPSNPSSLKYGDSFWLQCLEDGENADNSFQNGYILASKLFGPPELNSMQSAMTSQASRAQQHRRRKHKKDAATHHNIGLKGSTANAAANPNVRRQLSMILNDDNSQNIMTAARNKINASRDSVSSMVVDDDEKNDIESEETKKRLDKIATVCGEITMTRMIEMKRADLLSETNGQLTDERASRYNSKQSVHLGKWMAYSALREGSNDPQHMNPHPQPVRRGKEADGAALMLDEFGGNPSAAAHLCVFSNTPIFIQQDQYCIGSTAAESFSHWPKKSTSAISGPPLMALSSKLLRPDSALPSTVEAPAGLDGAASRPATRSAISAAASGNISAATAVLNQPPADPAVVAAQAAGNQASGMLINSFMTQLGENSASPGGSIASQSGSNKGFAVRSTSPQAGAAATEGFSSPNGASTGVGPNSPGATSVVSQSSAATGLNFMPSPGVISGVTTFGAKEEDDDTSDHVCLKKLVSRGPPYDFGVDRKCVWKICLLEVFGAGDSNQLSDKDRRAKKIMETANLVLKMSQLSREGGHTHIHAHQGHGHNLTSGEKFAKTLRKIVFSQSQELEAQHMAYQRTKEGRMKEYFAQKINNVIDTEKMLEANPKVGVASLRSSIVPQIQLHGSQVIATNELLAAAAQSAAQAVGGLKSPSSKKSNGFSDYDPSSAPFVAGGPDHNSSRNHTHQHNAARMQRLPIIQRIQVAEDNDNNNRRRLMNQESDLDKFGAKKFAEELGVHYVYETPAEHDARIHTAEEGGEEGSHTGNMSASGVSNQLSASSTSHHGNSHHHHSHHNKQRSGTPNKGITRQSHFHGDQPSPIRLTHQDYSSPMRGMNGNLTIQTSSSTGKLPSMSHSSNIASATSSVQPFSSKIAPVYHPSVLSEDIFRSVHKKLEPSMLILSEDPKAMKNYNNLSDGQRLLALHTTFDHIQKSTVVKVAPQQSHNADTDDSSVKSGGTSSVASTPNKAAAAAGSSSGKKGDQQPAQTTGAKNVSNSTNTATPAPMRKASSVRGTEKQSDHKAKLNRKLNMLLEEDQAIKKVLVYKDRKAKEKEYEMFFNAEESF